MIAATVTVLDICILLLLALCVFLPGHFGPFIYLPASCRSLVSRLLVELRRTNLCKMVSDQLSVTIYKRDSSAAFIIV
jgi:hypothetical protein